MKTIAITLAIFALCTACQTPQATTDLKTEVKLSDSLTVKPSPSADTKTVVPTGPEDTGDKNSPRFPQLHIAEKEGPGIDLDSQTYTLAGTYNAVSKWAVALAAQDSRERVLFTVKSPEGLDVLLSILKEGTESEKEYLQKDHEALFRKAIEEGKQLVGFYDSTLSKYAGIEPYPYPTDLFFYDGAYLLLARNASHLNSGGYAGSTASPPGLDMYILEKGDLPVKYVGVVGEIKTVELKGSKAP